MTFTDAQISALEKRAITPEQATDHGVIAAHTVTDLPADTPRYWEDYLPALVFPWVSPTGETQWQIRPDNPPKDSTGREKKYLFATGAKPVLNTLRFDPKNRVSLIVEGTCQSIAASLYAPAECNVFGIAGCNSWVSDGVPTGDLYTLDGTDVFICLDADAAKNFAVYSAGEQLAHAVSVAGVEYVRFLRLPGTGKAGLDDVLAGVPAARRDGLISNLIAEARDRGGQSADKPAAQKPRGSNSDRAADEAQVLAHAVLDRYTLARDESGALVGRSTSGVNRVALDLETVLQRTAAALYRDGSDTLIGTHAAREAGFYLAGLTDYPEVRTELRSYHDTRNHRLVIDIGDNTGDVITVTGDGWAVGPNTDETLWFRRPGKQQPLRRPESGGTLDMLRELLPTVGDDTWSLLLGWQLAAPFTGYQRPWLYFWGPRGSGKTGSALSMLSLFDPRNDLDMFSTNDTTLTVYNSMLPAFDNLSQISAQESDFFAQATTGVTHSRRVLFTTADEIQLSVRRTGVLTGIDVKGVRPDLRERLISIGMRRDEVMTASSRVERRREEMGGRALGAVLDAVAGILRKLRDGFDTTGDFGQTRFADYVNVLAAHDPGLAETYVTLSAEDREASAVEDPTVAAIVLWVNNTCDGDTGFMTSTDMMEAFNTHASRNDAATRWSTNARAFGTFLTNNFGEPVSGVTLEDGPRRQKRLRVHANARKTRKTGVSISPKENSSLREFPPMGLEKPSFAGFACTEPAVAVEPGRPESTVNTGLRADGTPNPEYRPYPPKNPGSEPGASLRHINSEDVTYSEWKRRMILGGRWVEPTPGFEWSDAA
ncbi:hypothetical protein ACGFKX_15635 [Pseudonocardia alni]|uniref:hypothetical protein n=1 Tax=Pseudonocardia alni TaxID=33907 RepID=UPI003714BA2E